MSPLSGLRCHRIRTVSPRLFLHTSWSHTRSLQTQAQTVNERFRILFMGRDEFSCLVLNELFQAKDVWSEIMIATQPDVHTGRRGSILSVSPVKTLGQSLQLPVHAIPKTKKEFRDWQLPEPFIQPTDSENPPPANHLLITASFGRILTDGMLSQFQPSNRLNVHPSLLPAYRGPAPLQHAIMNQEKETGVCVIKMLKKSEGIDAGSIWGRHKIDMPENATFTTLRDELGPLGGQLLVSVLRDLLNGKAVPSDQPTAIDSPKAPSITAQDAFVDFSTMSAQDIFSKFCGISHQKPLFTYLNGKPIQIRKLKIMDTLMIPPELIPMYPGWVSFSKRLRILIVRCADGSLLGVRVVRPEGKVDWKAHEFWNAMLQDLRDGGVFKQIIFENSPAV